MLSCPGPLSCTPGCPHPASGPASRVTSPGPALPSPGRDPQRRPVWSASPPQLPSCSHRHPHSTGGTPSGTPSPTCREASVQHGHGVLAGPMLSGERKPVACAQPGPLPVGVPRHAFSTPRRGRLASDAPASQAPHTGPRRNTWGPRRPLQPQGDRATVHTPPTGQALPCCLPGKRQDGPLGSLACPPLGPLAAPCIRPTCPQTFTKLPLSPAPTSVAGRSATQGLGAGPPGLRNGLFHFNGRLSCLLLPVL